MARTLSERLSGCDWWTPWKSRFLFLLYNAQGTTLCWGGLTFLKFWFIRAFRPIQSCLASLASPPQFSRSLCWELFWHMSFPSQLPARFSIFRVPHQHNWSSPTPSHGYCIELSLVFNLALSHAWFIIYCLPGNEFFSSPVNGYRMIPRRASSHSLSFTMFLAFMVVAS